MLETSEIYLKVNGLFYLSDFTFENGKYRNDNNILWVTI